MANHFIRRYNYDDIRFHYSQRFDNVNNFENSTFENIIFTVGKTNCGQALIMKTNTTGDVQWCKSYYVGMGTGEAVIAKEIIRIDKDLNVVDAPDIFVVYITNEDQTIHVLLAINADGDIVWRNKLLPSPCSKTSTRVFIKPYGVNRFLLVESPIAHNTNNLIKFGIIEFGHLHTTDIPAIPRQVYTNITPIYQEGEENPLIIEGLIIKDVALAQHTIILACTDINGHGYIVVFDKDRKQQYDESGLVMFRLLKQCKGDAFPIDIHDILVEDISSDGISLNLLGQLPENSNRFFYSTLNLNFTDTDECLPVYKWLFYCCNCCDNCDCFFKLCPGRYLCQYSLDDSNTYAPLTAVHLLGSEPNVVRLRWSKTIDLELAGYENNFTIRRVSPLTESNSLTFNLHGTSILAHTDLNMDSCLTLTDEDEGEADKIAKIAVHESSEPYYVCSIDYEVVESSFHFEDIGVYMGEMGYVAKWLCCKPDTGGNPGTGNPPPLRISLDANTSLQSPYVILQAAGSNGTGGTDGVRAGIHLRWFFDGILGRNHLPKVTSGTIHNFNRHMDFVRLYRTPYNNNIQVRTRLNLLTDTHTRNDSTATWTYCVDNRNIYVKFADKEKYNNASTQTPENETALFFTNYGDRLIEIESDSDLFFAANLFLTNTSSTTRLEVETISVSGVDNEKMISSRKSFTGNRSINLICENGKSVRYRIYNNAQISSIDFEFYIDVINSANTNGSWIHIARYALSTDDTTVFPRLERRAGTIHNRWPQYHNEKVDINSYRRRWQPTNGEKGLKHIVSEYLRISENPESPRAVVYLDELDELNRFIVSADQEADKKEFDGNDESNPNERVAVSLLDMLNFGAMDFHVARMLGLGCIDDGWHIGGSPLGNPANKFIYLIEYHTNADMGDGKGKRLIHHLSMSLPTSLNDARLPLPVHLEKYEGGIISDTDEFYDNLVQSNGYAPDGRSRYVTLFAEKEEFEIVKESTTFFSGNEFETHDKTFPVFAGLKYKRPGSEIWESLNKGFGEAAPKTIPLIVSEYKRILYTHRQEVSGEHLYRAFGINIFSRINQPDNDREALLVETSLRPSNFLTPPINVRAHLIREENPLMFTTEKEQKLLKTLLEDNEKDDKTLVRLSFDYHELYTLALDDNYLSMNVEDIDADSINMHPAYELDKDIEEDRNKPYANKVDVFFRKEVPLQIAGKITEVREHPTDNMLSIVHTDVYNAASQQFEPIIPEDKKANFIGSVFALGEDEFIVQDIQRAGRNPIVVVYKKEPSKLLVGEDLEANPKIQPVNSTELTAPNPLTYNGLFSIVENMQREESWENTGNSLLTPIPIGHSDWEVRKELIKTKDIENNDIIYVEESRGFWRDDAGIEEVKIEENNDNDGLYRITLPNFTLPEYPQDDDTGNYSINWHNGQVRVKTISGERKTFDVILKQENKAETCTILYIEDSAQSIITGNKGLTVNYYPGYKVYLYADSITGLNETNTLPNDTNELAHYSIFGLRTYRKATSHHSRFSRPAVMFGQKVSAPEIPTPRLAGQYTTRPDSFGKASFSFTTEFLHRPHSVLYYRSSDDAILSLLYDEGTKNEILAKSFEWRANFWESFMKFLTEEEFDCDNVSILPNKVKFNSKDEIKAVIYSTFVPLTEFPLLYNYINSGDYIPVALKQNIRDRDGRMLSPEDKEFRMAPMAKIITEDDNPEILFTDFTIDATSDNLYFYAAREMNCQMQLSEFSPIIGPVKPVNTLPSKSPEIVEVLPVLPGGISDAVYVRFEINSYPEEENIRKIILYRTSEPELAQSVRSMTIVKEIDLERENMLGNHTWSFIDDFEDLKPIIPYGDPLYYRIAVAREVEYPEIEGEKKEIVRKNVLSHASKIVATMVVETTNPESPTLYHDPSSNRIHWQSDVYKGIYHIYEMNSRGNWMKIADTRGLYFPVPDLDITNEGGQPIYRHFKVIAENTAGMISLEERILTIPVG